MHLNVNNFPQTLPGFQTQLRMLRLYIDSAKPYIGPGSSQGFRVFQVLKPQVEPQKSSLPSTEVQNNEVQKACKIRACKISNWGRRGNSKFVPHVVHTSTIFCKMSKRNCLGLFEKLPNRIHQEQLYRDKCQFLSMGDDRRSLDLPRLGSTVSRFPTRMNTRTMSFQIRWL